MKKNIENPKIEFSVHALGGRILFIFSRNPPSQNLHIYQ